MCPACEARELLLAVGCSASSDTPSWDPAREGGCSPRGWRLEPSSSKPSAYTAPDGCRPTLFKVLGGKDLERTACSFEPGEGRHQAGLEQAAACSFERAKIINTLWMSLVFNCHLSQLWPFVPWCLPGVTPALQVLQRSMSHLG